MYEVVAENIYDICIELPKTSLKNLHVYLVKGQERNLLIDTGMDTPQCLRALDSALREMEVDMRKTDIFLTHLHPDHIGAVRHFAGKNTSVFMGWQDVARQLSSYQPCMDESFRVDLRMAGFPEYEIEQYLKLLNSDYAENRFVGYTAVNDGEEFEYAGYRFTAVATPGHSPGHMCLYEKTRKILISGDHILFHITPNISRWRGVNDSLRDYVDSLLKIRDYEVDYLLPAHRTVEGTLSERVDEIIEHHSDRVRETLDVLDRYSGITAYDIASKMNWNIRYEGDWSHFPTPQKFFAVNEICAHLDYLVNGQRAIVKRYGEIEYYYPVRVTDVGNAPAKS